jgi:putative zinc finger/helix-turn-helix YgiT family protein
MTPESKTAEVRKGRDRPFPWVCANCLKDEVYPVTMPYTTEVKHDGRMYKLTIPALTIPKCRACGELVFSLRVDDQIVAALRAEARLLTPEQIRQGREALGLQSKELAERLGVAKETLSRWETGMMIQSRAMDNLLRAYFAVPEVRAVLRGAEQDPALGTPAVLHSPVEGPNTDHRRNGGTPMCREYRRDELVRALRTYGPRLMRQFFQPCADLKELIQCSVLGSTFRSFRGLSRPPSRIFREWAASRLSPSVMAELGQIKDQTQFDQFASACATSLAQHWRAEGGKPLPCGTGRKLLDLLLKEVIRSMNIREEDRRRLVPLLYVPLDQFSLAAVRQCAASREFGPPITIPSKPTMGFVASMQQYGALQQLMRAIAAVAGVPPICIDLVVWNQAHGM